MHMQLRDCNPSFSRPYIFHLNSLSFDRYDKFSTPLKFLPPEFVLAMLPPHLAEVM